ncbi:hypothetical protein WMY93_009307 [Mugilogobius chulae]|uniref:phosphoethanolamine N-methyltransferase n=1 Tax=Mugilogobius chulae TaxID=88201 RepID=A0AAW0PEZ9_9GOBI
MERVRDDMTQFWKTHSQNATLEEMMLDTHAQELTEQELPEILSMLPSLENCRVLELGAGIGRYTRHLLTKAQHVIAVDFMENFVERNRKDNGHYSNATFLQADVTKLEIPQNSIDFIFSNWLLMYLSDEELHSLAEKMLGWLRPGGFFFLESPATIVQMKNNPNQICWLLEKVQRSLNGTDQFKTFQQFLDQKQYTRNGILRYEKMFGAGFVSTGGLSTTKEFVDLLDLKPGEKVLDVGCGIGGGDFYMAKTFGVDVLGLDLSENMVDIALERAAQENMPSVMFEVADATKRIFPESSFDVIYSRDTILHITDKLALFKRFFSWLKPGGRLLISDYCCGEKPWTPAFETYVKQRGYILHTPAEYGEFIRKAGFSEVQAEDKTSQFIQVIEEELQKAKKLKHEFILVSLEGGGKDLKH